MDYVIEELTADDYELGYLDVLEQLTTVESESISYTEFKNHFNNQSDNVKSFVMKDRKNNKITGCGTIVIEKKYIHKLGSVGHIEDIVIDKEYRKYGLGKDLISYLVEYGKKNGCYKILLTCSEKNIGFYEKCGFKVKDVSMSLYFS